MIYQKEINVICLADTKQCALFFDSVMPISYFFEIMFRDEVLDLYKKYTVKGHKVPPEQILTYFQSEGEVLASLLRSDSSNLKSIVGYLDFFIDLFKWIMDFTTLCGKISESHKLYPALAETIGGTIPESIYKASNVVRDKIETHKKTNDFFRIDAVFLDLLCLFYIENIPQFGKSGLCFRDYLGAMPEVKKGYRTIALPSPCFEYLPATNNDVSIYLSNLMLVDTRKTKWSKIIEFRKDTDSRRKLRNLRLFFHRTYRGESLSFIEDDLERRLEEYSEICKNWEFETTTSVLSAIMDSHNLHLAIGTCLASAILGGPYFLTGAAFGKSLIEIGKITLGFAKARHSFQKLKSNHDMAFLIEAKGNFEDTRN